MAVHEWFNELQYLMVNDLRKGLDNYRGEYPPNLIQFYDACTQKPIGSPAPCYQMYHSEPNRRAITHDNEKAIRQEGDNFAKILKEAYEKAGKK